MLNQKYISSSCIISNQHVYLNGKVVYEHAATDVASFLLSVYQHYQFSYPKFYKMDQLCKLGWLAAELLLQNQQLSQRYAPEQVGLVISNANSSLDADLKYLDTMHEAASPALFVYTLPNIVIGEICIRHKFKGENEFLVSDQFHAGLMELQVNLLMDSQVIQACICGWVDLLGQDYKAALYLVEQQKNNNKAVDFSTVNMEHLFKIVHE